METKLRDPLLEHFLARLGAKSLSFPFPAPEIQVAQTHISIVLLAGDFAYKIKKPARFPFVDYSTLEKRRDFCRMEVDLNRRLSEGLYLGVVPLVLKGEALEVEGKGKAVEYAVKMKRLPDTARLSYFLQRGLLREGFWDKLAYRLARFYRNTARGEEVSKWATSGAIREDWRELLRQLGDFPAEILTPSLRDRLTALSLDSLEKLQGRIDLRSPRARDGHGDLRLEHIYYFPDEPEPVDLAIIDCVEFNPRYRCGDPLLDIAFLLMDLEACGFWEAAQRFTRSFLVMSHDASDGLLDFYIAYRHLVRGLVRTLQSREEDFPSAQRKAAEGKARLHFLRCLARLEEPAHRPCLVMVSGLPGTGKSSLAHLLKEREGFEVLSSDAIRKELAGFPLEKPAGARYEHGLYEPWWTERTYGEMLKRAQDLLLQGRRVVVDACFGAQEKRESFFRLARTLGIPFLFFICKTGEAKALQRLSRPDRFGSDATAEIYRNMKLHWEETPPEWVPIFMDTEVPLEDSFAGIRSALKEKDLTR